MICWWSIKIQGAKRPVEQVSWQDCKDFCDKVGLALPSEAQWEYASSAGSEETIAGTGRIDDMAWHQRNSGEWTHPVGEKSPNDFGLHDTHGNVAEWCEDVLDWNFYDKPESRGVNPVCRSGGEDRTFRGGAYRDGEFHSRSSIRPRSDPSRKESFIGFRPVFMP
jgi:formylglycine-generating enzyme required for sulfatase activity